MNNQTTAENLPTTARSSSNGLVKVKLGFIQPNKAGLEEPDSFHSSVRKESLSSRLVINYEKLERSSLSASQPKAKSKNLMMKRSISRVSSVSSKPNFTFTYFSGCNSSNKTSRQKGSESRHLEGHRIDSALDVEAILSNNKELTEYLRKKEAEELIRRNKDVRYKRVINSSRPLGSVGGQSAASPPTTHRKILVSNKFFS